MMQTESTSGYRHLEKMGFLDLVHGINHEDSLCHERVANESLQIALLCELVFNRLDAGGRLFYLGAGTSGRLGIVDASECPPTFGVSFDKVIGIIAGGDGAIRKAVEFAEDDEKQGFKDLEAYGVNDKDVVVGIAASGKTPYVLRALQTCSEKGIATGAVVCNKGSLMSQVCDVCIEIETGPEFITGSTRMKAGTVTKMALNIITTTVMIKLGHVKDNKMVDMQLTNHKLIERGTLMVMDETGWLFNEAQIELLKAGSVRRAVEAWQKAQK